MTRAFLVTGATYVNRRALRSFGCTWNREEGGYIAPESSIAMVTTIPGLKVAPYETDADPFRKLEGEDLRAYREARQERYRARLIDRAERAERRAGEARARISPSERDFLRLFEPVKVGHHSQRRHEKLLERFNRSFEDECREIVEAQRLRQRADSLARVQVAGDAARQAKEENGAARAEIGLGDRVKDIVYGEGVVVRINPQTYQVKFGPRGYLTNLLPGSLTLIAKGIPEAKCAPEFRKGDAVWWHRHGISNRAHCKPIPATVKRRTPRGYSVEYTLRGKFLGQDRADSYTETASAADLEPRDVQEASA